MAGLASLAILISMALSILAFMPTQPNRSEPDKVPKAPLAKRTDGAATFYYQQGVAGSCGNWNPDSAYVAAISPIWMSKGNFCGRTIAIRNNGGGLNNRGAGKTVTVQIADTCMGCDANRLDLSVGAFQALTGGNYNPPGKINVVWYFNL